MPQARPARPAGNRPDSQAGGVVRATRSESMKVVIPGGSGQVGTILARALHADGHDVVVLTRQPQISPWRTVVWDGATLGPWVKEVDGSDVVINLAGRSVNCRYTPTQSARDPRFQSEIDARCGRGHRAGAPAPSSLAASQHGDDLRSPLRRAERRGDRLDRRSRARRTYPLELQHRSGASMGARARGSCDAPKRAKSRSDQP